MIFLSTTGQFVKFFAQQVQNDVKSDLLNVQSEDKL